jgi:hypothetical protein
VLSAGLALTMLGIGVIQLVSGPSSTDVRLRAATGVFALALIPFSLDPLAVLVLFALALVAQVVFELARHEGHKHLAEI